MKMKVKPKNKLEAMSINEELGDIPTHYMKSGSSMRPKTQLTDLQQFKRRIIPESHRGAPFQYDLWFNTNELHTIRSFLYTDFLGKGIYCRVNSIIINDKVLHSIVNSEVEIDEERVQKIINNLENKYVLTKQVESHPNVIFLPGSNQMTKDLISWPRIKELVKQGWKIKPHPITAHIWIAKLKEEYGSRAIYGKKDDGYALLRGAEKVAICPNSEMGIAALLLGKEITSVALPRTKREKNLVTYDSIYGAIAGRKQGSRNALKQILSSDRSGIIFNFDEDAEERMERYLLNFWEYKIT